MARFLDHKQVRGAVQTVIAGDDVRCAVAFWGDGALKALFGSKKRASKARIICDLSMGGTNPEELALLGAPDNPDLKHLRGLHAKLYLSSAGMVVTSANASNRGIGFVEPAALTECGTFHRPDTTAFRKGAKWFDTIWGKADMVDPEALATARAAWAKRPRHGALKGAPLTAPPDTLLRRIEAVLAPWCECIQLNTTQAIAVHPGAPAQLPHRDQDMWRGPVGEVEYLVNVMWPLTDFTEENGATRVWPESHGVNALAEPDGAPLAAEMAPGAALLFLGSTLHGAGANRTWDVRRGIVIGYALGWLKPYENQWLAYPPDVARTFPPDLAALVGYRQHRPNLGNFEGQCPSVLLDGRADQPLGAVDALRPDQQVLVDAYAQEQREAP